LEITHLATNVWLGVELGGPWLRKVKGAPGRVRIAGDVDFFRQG